MTLMPKPSQARNRTRRKVAAVSVASFLALFGYQAARMHAGGDPALAQTKQKAASTQSDVPAQDSTSSNGYEDNSGQSAGAQDYYTPSQSDPPTTGSS